MLGGPFPKRWLPSKTIGQPSNRALLVSLSSLFFLVTAVIRSLSGLFLTLWLARRAWRAPLQTPNDMPSIIFVKRNFRSCFSVVSLLDYYVEKGLLSRISLPRDD